MDCGAAAAGVRPAIPAPPISYLFRLHPPTIRPAPRSGAPSPTRFSSAAVKPASNMAPTAKFERYVTFLGSGFGYASRGGTEKRYPPAGRCSGRPVLVVKLRCRKRDAGKVQLITRINAQAVGSSRRLRLYARNGRTSKTVVRSNGGWIAPARPASLWLNIPHTADDDRLIDKTNLRHRRACANVCRHSNAKGEADRRDRSD
jgi:hypothetical protein